VSAPWEDVLDFWFGPDGEDRSQTLWFGRSDEVDATIRERFGDRVARARAGDLDHWNRDVRGRLALVLLLDQFTRNIHRDSAEAFSADPRAQAETLAALEAGEDRNLSLVERWFLYMPLMHAEDRTLQARAIEVFESLVTDAPPDQQDKYRWVLDFAIRHREIVDRFGRFPHRNRVLGRDTTPEEAAFLETFEGF
jgi:uncharacterized protein (DUF924 family)